MVAGPHTATVAPIAVSAYRFERACGAGPWADSGTRREPALAEAGR